MIIWYKKIFPAGGGWFVGADAFTVHCKFSFAMRGFAVVPAGGRQQLLITNLRSVHVYKFYFTAAALVIVLIYLHQKMKIFRFSESLTKN